MGELKKCKGCGSCMGNAMCMADLEKLLSGVGKLSDKEFNSDKKGSCLPGCAGVNRGRGDAPMYFGDKKEVNSSSFKPVTFGDDEFIPGAVLEKKAIKAEKIPPAEFQETMRSGIKVNDRVISCQSAGSLGPERRNIAEKYFRMVSESGNE